MGGWIDGWKTDRHTETLDGLMDGWTTDRWVDGWIDV